MDACSMFSAARWLNVRLTVYDSTCSRQALACALACDHNLLPCIPPSIAPRRPKASAYISEVSLRSLSCYSGFNPQTTRFEMDSQIDNHATPNVAAIHRPSEA